MLFRCARTLDGLDGDIQTQTWCADMKPGERRVLDDGLLARDGWTLLDDSGNYIFDGSADWNWVADRKDADGYASVDVWLPEGQWYELHSGTLLDGGSVPCVPEPTARHSAQAGHERRGSRPFSEED